MARGNDCCQQAFGGRLVPNNNAGNDDAGGHADGNAGGHADGNAEERSNAGDGKDDGRQGWQCPRKSRRESRLPTNPPPARAGFQLEVWVPCGGSRTQGVGWWGTWNGSKSERLGQSGTRSPAPPRRGGGEFSSFFFRNFATFRGVWSPNLTSGGSKFKLEPSWRPGPGRTRLCHTACVTQPV